MTTGGDYWVTGDNALRRRDYHALRCLCGVAPVTRRSGKSLIVVRRLAAHDRLRDAAYHWARVAAAAIAAPIARRASATGEPTALTGGGTTQAKRPGRHDM